MEHIPEQSSNVSEGPEEKIRRAAEIINMHPFDYGIEHALNEPDSYIVFEGEGYVLRFNQAQKDDHRWYGDCVADAALSMSALQDAHAEVGAYYEYMQYDFPEVGVSKVTHYRLVAEGGIPIEHSQFYKKLNPDQRISHTELSPIDNAPLEMQSLIPFAAGQFNYKEFSHNGMNHVVIVRAEQSDPEEGEIGLPAINYSVLILAQDVQGKVVKRYQVNQRITNSLVEMIIEPQVPESYIRFLMGNMVTVFENGESDARPFDDDVIRSHFVKTFQSLFNATIRGELKKKEERGRGK